MNCAPVIPMLLLWHEKWFMSGLDPYRLGVSHSWWEIQYEVKRVITKRLPKPDCLLHCYRHKAKVKGLVMLSH